MEVLIMIYIYFMQFLLKNIFLLSNFLLLTMFLILLKFCWIDWSYIILDMSFNIYSYGLLLMLMWIMSLIIMNLILNSNLCLFLNYLLLMVMYMNFLMMNLIMFYFMFEISLLLIFYMIIKWGYSKSRFLASYYLMFYTMMFSLPMLFIIYYLLNMNFTLNFMIMELYNIYNLSLLLLFYLLMSFLVKIPMFMFHSWLMKAHVEAPFYGSMILASIMLKLGSYGLLRLMMIFKKLFVSFNIFIMINSLFGMLILSILCLRQIDMKSLVAMSSVVHMGLMLMGMMTLFKLGILGGYLMMISHGFVSSGLFYLINIIYEKTNTRMIFINKGMMIYMPSMSMLWFMLCTSNGGSPFSLNLVSEIMLLMSLISYLKFLFIFLMMYCIFSFIYSIYLFSFLQHGNYYFKFKMNNNKLINYLSLLLHWIPLNIMILNLNMII